MKLPRWVETIALVLIAAAIALCLAALGVWAVNPGYLGHP